MERSNTLFDLCITAEPVVKGTTVISVEEIMRSSNSTVRVLPCRRDEMTCEIECTYCHLHWSQEELVEHMIQCGVFRSNQQRVG